MAGYLGTKAVLLSTTAADVIGNAEIGGDLTVGGNITSTGIDDNASSTAMTLDASGNVGIGTSSPDTALNIGFSGADQSNSLRIEGSNGSSERYALDIEADGENAKTYFKVGVGGGVPTPRMTIDSSGNVGIGTTSPTRPLSVTDTTGDGTGGIKLASYLPTFEMDDISAGGTSFILQHDGTSTLFKHDTTERMRIDSSGRVTMPYQPAFRAHTFTPMSGVGTIVYTVAAHNIGSHYNTSTGRFTAPVAGVYHFDFSVLMDADNSTQYVRVLFAINGVRDETRNGDTLTGGTTGAFTNYSYHAVNISHSFYLSANDTVEVSAENPNGQTYQSSGGYGSFSGYLIG